MHARLCSSKKIARFRTIPYDFVRYRTISYDFVRFRTISYDFVRFRTMPSHAHKQHNNNMYTCTSPQAHGSVVRVSTPTNVDTAKSDQNAATAGPQHWSATGHRPFTGQATGTKSRAQQSYATVPSSRESPLVGGATAALAPT